MPSAALSAPAVTNLLRVIVSLLYDALPWTRRSVEIDKGFSFILFLFFFSLVSVKHLGAVNERLKLILGNDEETLRTSIRVDCCKN